MPLLCTRSAESIIGMLGVLKAGCAYVPIVPDYPKARKSYILEEINAPLLLCGPQTKAEAATFGLPTLNIAEAQHPPPAFQRPSVQPRHLAYVLYTSGSTGKPKGVMIEHRCVDNQICAFQEYAPLPPGFNGLSLSPFVFDASVWEIYLPLFFGGTLFLADKHLALTLDAFISFLDQKAIHSCYLPASLLPPLTRKLAQRPPLPIRRVLTGAEPIKQRVWDQFQASIPGMELVNIYGPTETTVGATYYKCGAPTPPDGRVPIGAPVAGYTLYLVNTAGDFCKPGEVGEIWVAGPGVGRGYVSPSPENEGRFTTNPFDPEGGRLYKTGDLAHYLPDGNLEFDRRKDLQVKVRGHRIELGEVEAIMEQVPHLLEAVAITRQEANGNNLLLGYYRKAEAATITARDIREAMARKVPPYMIPTQLIELQDFPRTPNGKIDRRNLPEAPQRTARFLEPPTNATEEQLLEIWQAVLQQPQIGVADAFFDLGGHSLLALQLLSNIKERFGYTLTFQELQEAPTIRSQAERLRGGQPGTPGLPAVQQQPPREVYPLSSAQKRLWFIEQANQASSAYNIPFEFRLHGPLQPELLVRALNQLVSKHHALRSRFLSSNGIPELHIAAECKVPLRKKDLRGAPAAETTIREWSRYFARFSFDLREAPLLRLGLLRLGDEDWHLFFCIHHIISDASSISLLMQAWSQEYAALLHQGQTPGEAPGFQYTDYTIWQAQAIEKGHLQPQLDYWAQQLKGAPDFLPLPADFKRPQAAAFEGGETIRYLPDALYAQLREHARQSGVSLSTLAFTGFAALLQQYSRQEDFIIGLPVANRSQKALADIQGFFINMLPIRVQVSGKDTLAHLTRQLHQRVAEALSNQDAPFDLILQGAQVARIPGVNPLFQVMFNFQNAYDGEFELAGLKVTPLGYHNEVAQMDLTLFMSESQGRMKCTFEYNAQLFQPERMERLAGHYLRLLQQLLQAPAQEIARLPLLTEAERAAAIGQHQLAECPARLPTLIQQFEAAAAQNASRTALVSGRTRWSYAQLNERANQLAHYWLSKGLPKGARVGLLLPRGPELLTALLAAQKAGCSYLPLDPSHPVKRLQLILSDARPALIYTTESLGNRWADAPGQTLMAEQFQEAAAQMPRENPTLQPLQPEDELYLIYTSGSTGRPKGVCVGNHSVSNFLAALDERLGISPADRFYAVTTIAFDIAVLELYWPLLNGATVVLASREAALDPRLIAKDLEEHGITLMQGTPATWKMLIQDGWAGKTDLRALSGGEALDKSLAAQLRERCAEAWNFYGPTETTVYSAVHRVQAQDLTSGPTSLVPVGHPLRHNWLYVLNEAMQPVPAGVAGEIFIGGIGLAKGYLNLPEQTAARFLPNPFVPGTLLYRTGDLGFFHPSGALEFLERLDQQVKIRGFRIELAEIEQALRQHPQIADCAVQP